MKHKNDIAGHVAPSKNDLCAALRAWINQRPGLEFANYGNAASYRAELRGITRQRADTLQMLRAIELRDSITAADMLAELQSHSRLFWDIKKSRLEYVTGQYWCTEYRRAVAAMLASVLWGYYRANLGKGRLVHNTETGELFERYGPKDQRAGDFIRSKALAEFGRGITSRWFN